MEDLPFPDARFDGVCVCFAFHEMPPARVRIALQEIARVLRPGGLLLVAEPSPVQFRSSFATMVRNYGWRGGYFRMLVRFVHEPYLEKWHGFALADEAGAAGLRVTAETDASPVRWWRFERRERTTGAERGELHRSQLATLRAVPGQPRAAGSASPRRDQ